MMQYELSIQLSTVKHCRRSKNLQFIWCLQNGCTHSKNEGQTLCLFLEDLHMNVVRTNLSGCMTRLQPVSPPEAERVIGASTPLWHPVLRTCSQRYQLMPGNQTCFLIPTTQEATASPEYLVSAVEEV